MVGVLYRGVGLFGRLGFADDDTNPVERFLQLATRCDRDEAHYRNVLSCCSACPVFRTNAMSVAFIHNEK